MFAPDAPGELRRLSGEYATRYGLMQYDTYSFVPNPLGDYPALSPRVMGVVSRASMALARLSELGEDLPNPDMLRRPAQRPFVFAVWKDHRKIDRDQWPTGMPNLAVPQLDEHEWALTGSVDDMIAKVDGLRGNVTKDRLDEGIVWHLHEDQRLSEGLANELGSNRCFKIINNKYLTKNGL